MNFIFNYDVRFQGGQVQIEAESLDEAQEKFEDIKIEDLVFECRNVSVDIDEFDLAFPPDGDPPEPAEREDKTPGACPDE